MTSNVVFDIETNGLNGDQVHCVAISVNGLPPVVYTDHKGFSGVTGTLEEAYKVLLSADLLIGHNIIGFDIPFLESREGLDFSSVAVHDTLVQSALLFPDMMERDMKRKSVPPKLKGRHSLKSWGYRLRCMKGDFNDGTEEVWDVCTQDMLDYCKQDVVVSNKIYQHLDSQCATTPAALDLEQKFYALMSKQEAAGVQFDIDGAIALQAKMQDKLEALEAPVKALFPPYRKWVPLKRVAKNKKNGDLTVAYMKQMAKGAHEDALGSWGHWKESEINLNSRLQLGKMLVEHFGFKPKSFTESGQIKIDADTLKVFRGTELEPLLELFDLRKALAFVKGWLEAVVPETSRIHGRINTLGARTRRCTHSSPNLAQVPSCNAYMGAEMRGLFGARKGFTLCGCDASELEIRALCHYIHRYDGGTMSERVLRGDKSKGTDVHTANQHAAGLPTRDAAKTFFYAFLYGAGKSALADLLGLSDSEAEKVIDRFMKASPELAKLKGTLENRVRDQGYFKAIDGQRQKPTHSHTALSGLLQGFGGIVMKKYAVMVYGELTARGYVWGTDYQFVLNIHDEIQAEVRDELVDEFKDIFEGTFPKVSEVMKLNIPLAGEFKSGSSWAETH